MENRKENLQEISSKIEMLDVVALTEELPDRGLRQGQVGTVVEFLEPDVFEVEFSDNDGCTMLVWLYAPNN